MSSTLDDEDLALSINPSYTRRGSGRPPPQTNHDRHVHSPATAAAPRSSSPGSRKPNQRLGQYTMIKTLGEGSFGKVKLAVHQVTGQKVALKIISRRKLMARDMAGRVEREIQYLQLLRHPHIIKLFTVITTPGEIIMVLEYAGSELFNYIVENGKMREDKARKFFQQIVCAVEYCHRHKIVHRDLKPENLLLDDQLHVKIADFGLSNIMTDGNFLKTSCGSPNYAAPEVISGKLYAGPEVDVWSCGVILYVLLVGRLPFDDDYIPTLFKKIAQGSYSMPAYLSPGAMRLIKKMLHVSPVHRITVQEIRNDPWFTKDLPEYLQPPVEEFMDTGVDPNKAIDPRSLAPNKPPEMQAKIHDSVVGKLGKTMGYGPEDVQQALAIDEPNAIKDAYMIVRENQIMAETTSYTQDPAMQPFLAQSPPAHGEVSPIASITEAAARASPKPAPPPPVQRHASEFGPSSHSEARSPGNTIAVLPSSLPDYHQAFMKGHPKPNSPPQGRDTHMNNIAENQLQSPEQQAATVKRLKPHSKSQANLERMNKPEGMTPVQPPKKKPTGSRWQFGIRSRNQPSEAMLALYKALKAIGAEWELPRARRHDSNDMGSDGDISDDSSSSDVSDSEPRTPEGTSATPERPVPNGEPAVNGHPSQTTNSTSSSASPRGRRRRKLDGHSRYGSDNDWGYTVPADPWIINARFRKDGMHPIGVMQQSSTQSSRIDLPSDHAKLSGNSNSLVNSLNGSSRSSSTGPTGAVAAANEPPGSRSRRSSTLSSTGSVAGAAPIAATQTSHPVVPSIQSGSVSTTGMNVATPVTSAPESRTGSRGNLPNAREPHNLVREADDSAYIYITIQLYSIDKGFFLVDFKCAGYERLMRRLVRELEEMGVSDGNKVVQTEATAEEQVEGSDGSGGEEQKEWWREREEYVGDGRAAEEKDVSSPFPFLDVASRLIIQLAEAD
ncbi:MAG: Protein kinase [Chrysothrix sp. TS-e1954]|nr:MAG: Protein kinase [Chrysothrix sp. TS-e1954]